MAKKVPFWERDGRIEGGDPGKTGVKVTYNPAEMELHVVRYWEAPQGEMMPLRNQPTITQEDVDLDPGLLKPIIAFLNDPKIKYIIDSTPELKCLAG